MGFFIDILKDNPLSIICGNGYMSSPKRYGYSGAHNSFIRLIHDSGIIGLLVYVWLFYSILKLLLIHFRRSHDDWQPIYYSFFFLIIALLLSSLTGAFFSVGHVLGSFLGFFLSLLAVIVESIPDSEYEVTVSY